MKRAVAMFCLISAMLVGTSTLARAPISTVRAATPESVDISSLVIQLQGFDEPIWSDNYTWWTGYLGSLNYPHSSDYLCNGPPEDFIIAQYDDPARNKTVYVEIYGYENKENATSEYSSQVSSGSSGNIMNRFEAPQILFHHGRFMVFAFCPTTHPYWPNYDNVARDALANCTQEFVDNMFKLIPSSDTQPPAPTINFTGKVAWGVKPGDIMSWQDNRTVFTGYPGGGMSSSHDSYNITMEIVRITDDNLSILIRSPKSSPSDFDYHENYVDVNTEFKINLPQSYTYFWANVTDPATDLDGHSPYPLIFPVYTDTLALEDVIKSHTRFEKFTEDSAYLNGHYSTSPQQDFTPVETQYGDVTVHKGSGITTGADFYYNNNQYSITRSDTLTLKYKNFDLNSRIPVPEFPSVTILSMLLISLLLIITVLKKTKHTRTLLQSCSFLEFSCPTVLSLDCNCSLLEA